LYQGGTGPLFEGVMAVRDLSDPPSTWVTAAAAFERWRHGEQDGLEELVRRLRPVLWQVVRATGLNRQCAEDVVQTTWLALVHNAGTINSPQAVAGWLCAAARREAWRVSKQQARQRPAEDAVLADRMPAAPGPEPQVVLDDESARLWLALGQLPERCQRLLRMVATEARPDYAHVAEALEMPVGSIGPTRGRCLDKLRHQLVQVGGAP